MQYKNAFLFDNKERTDSTSIRHGETLFQYYDRSSDVHAVKARTLLNSWFPKLPDMLKELILNIPVQNQRKVYEHNKNFVSVTYEAYIYMLLLGLGIQTEQIKYEHLAVNGKYPEFFVDLGDDSFYVEATVAGDVSIEEQILSEIVDHVNDNIVSDLYNLRLTTFDPSVNGKHKHIIQSRSDVTYKIEKWLNALNIDLVCNEKYVNIDNVTQKLVLNFKGLGLIFKPIIHDEYANTIVSISPYIANSRDTDAIIRKKVERKHEQLRGLEYPCILAINTLYDFAAGEWDLSKALLGDVCMSFPVNESLGQATSFRLPNGVFGPHKAQHNFLSGVILSPGLSIGNIHRVSAEFLINPWATHHMKDNNPLMQLKRMSVDPVTGEVFNHDGKDISSLINA